MNKTKAVLYSAGTLVAAAVFATGAHAADTYMPACFTPAADSASVISYPAKKGPYKIALVNGYVGNDWRSTTIQAAKAWGRVPTTQRTCQNSRSFRLATIPPPRSLRS